LLATLSIVSKPAGKPGSVSSARVGICSAQDLDASLAEERDAWDNLELVEDGQDGPLQATLNTISHSVAFLGNTHAGKSFVVNNIIDCPDDYEPALRLDAEGVPQRCYVPSRKGLPGPLVNRPDGPASNRMPEAAHQEGMSPTTSDVQSTFWVPQTKNNAGIPVVRLVDYEGEGAGDILPAGVADADTSWGDVSLHEATRLRREGTMLC